MSFACWIINATDTHSGCVLVTASPRQHVTLLVLRIGKWCLDFWKICEPYARVLPQTSTARYCSRQNNPGILVVGSLTPLKIEDLTAGDEVISVRQQPTLVYGHHRSFVLCISTYVHKIAKRNYYLRRVCLSVCLSVRPSFHMNSTPIGRTVTKLVFWVFSEKLKFD
jgi:hypothetical protein